MHYSSFSILLTLFVFTGLLSFHPSEAFLEWLWGLNSDDSPETPVVRTNGVKFEVQTTDEKFLQLKDVFENMSELDACNNIVIYKLKKRCGELSDEELGKLSVQLFNCQATVEKRPTYKCTDGMTLAECTKDMDGTTWNGYQIVNNRARALCYATQHQQFRKLTEITVNQLMSQAHGQLEYLQQLQSGQEQLHQMTTHTVRELYESQKDLIGNQQTLKMSQDSVLSQIHSNMEELKHEKAMIATGNKELADLTENIRSKLGNESTYEATNQLQRQENTQLDSHEKILKDLTNIQKKSHDALNKLDESSAHLVKNHEEMLSNYERMYENMMRINATVSHLLSTVNVMQNHLDEKINWFSTLLHMADDKLSILTCGALHIGYFLFAALTASFLQTPAATRLILFVLVALNASMEIQYNQSLDFASISLFLFIVCLVNWIYIWWSRRHKVKSRPEPPFVSGSLTALGMEQHSDEDDENQFPDTTTTSAGTPHVTPLSPVEMRQLTTNLSRLYNSLNESGLQGKGNSMPRGSNSTPRNPFREPQPSTSAFTPYRRPEQVRADSSTAKENVAKVQRYLENLEENSSLGGDFETPDNNSSAAPRYRHSTPQRSSSRMSTSSNRSMCQGFTKAGIPCRLGCSSGSEYCYRHRGQGSSS